MLQYNTLSNYTFPVVILLCFILFTSVASAQDPVSGAINNVIRIVEPTKLQTDNSFPVNVDIKLPQNSDPNTFYASLIVEGQDPVDITPLFSTAQGTVTAELGSASGVLQSTSDSSIENTLFVSVTLDSGRIAKNAVSFFVLGDDLSSTQQIVPSVDGGDIELSGISTLTFAPASFPDDRLVTVAQEQNAYVASVFEPSSALLNTGPRLSYEVKINVGSSAPINEVQAQIVVPEEFRQALTNGDQIRVLGLNYWETDFENNASFRLLSERFSSDSMSVSVTLPANLFTNGLTVDGSYEAILTLASTPTAQTLSPIPAGKNQKHLIGVEFGTYSSPDGKLVSAFGRFIGDDVCLGSSLGAPLDPLPDASSPYGPRDPNIGSSNFHEGTDYPVPNGTPVLSMADGVITRHGENFNTAPNGKITGYGYYVIVQHTDGSQTLYAHLKEDSFTVQVQQLVSKGQVIALSNNSGGSTGPHLHAEYAPNGSIFADDATVDIEPCIGGNVGGSITVFDSGPVADDAFSVAINNITVCETEIGASNTCAIGNLLPGTATLTLTAVIAPDNAGTYTVVLADGLTFLAGGNSRTGNIPQNAAVSFEIVIPGS